MKRLLIGIMIFTMVFGLTAAFAHAYANVAEDYSITIARAEKEIPPGLKKEKKIPPGLLKKGGLPPGLLKRIDNLPPGIIKRFLDIIDNKEEYKGEAAYKYVTPENFNTHSGTNYRGINVGFKLQDLKISDLKNVEVSLYKDSKLLVKNVANSKFYELNDSTKQLSTPFIITQGTYTEEYWDLGSYNWKTTDKPTKAVITLTDNDGNKYIVENTSLSEATATFNSLFPNVYTGSQAYPFVTPENFNTHATTNYKGINVGFRLQSLKVTDLVSVEVSLYKGTTKLVTNTTNREFLKLSDSIKQHSTPFIITSGTYQELYWNLGRRNWDNNDKPTRAEIKVTDIYGNVYIVENNSLSESNITFDNLFPTIYLGDAALPYIKPQNFNTHKGNNYDYMGVNVGFKLESLSISDLVKVEVSLYKDSVLLATNVTNDKFLKLSNTERLHSTPFTTTAGKYIEEYWDLGVRNWRSTDKPTKAVIKATDKHGNVYIVENNNLSEATAKFVDLFSKEYVGNDAMEFVIPLDFYTYEDSSSHKGIKVDFELVGLNMSAVKKVDVSIVRNDTILVTNTTNSNFNLLTTLEHQAIFVISPSNYNQIYWTAGVYSWNSRRVPTAAIIRVTDYFNNTYVVNISDLDQADVPYVDLF